MASDLISRDELIARHCAENCGCTRSECGFTYADDGCDCCTFVKEIENAPAVDAEPVITGETSDGYHTFNELYHHRAILWVNNRFIFSKCKTFEEYKNGGA